MQHTASSCRVLLVILEKTLRDKKCLSVGGILRLIQKHPFLTCWTLTDVGVGEDNMFPRAYVAATRNPSDFHEQERNEDDIDWAPSCPHVDCSRQTAFFGLSLWCCTRISNTIYDPHLASTDAVLHIFRPREFASVAPAPQSYARKSDLGSFMRLGLQCPDRMRSM